MANLSESPQSSKRNHSIIEVMEFCQDRNLPARVVGQKPAVEIDNLVGRVGDFDPIGGIPFLIGKREPVDRHEFRDQRAGGQQRTRLHRLDMKPAS